MNFYPVSGTELFEGFCIVKSAEKRTTARGTQYLDLTLSDNGGEINAKLWDYRETPATVFAKFDFVKVRGTYVEFNETKQFRIDRIRKVTEADGVNIADYVPSAGLPGEEMLAEVEKIIASFADRELASLVTEIIGKYRDKLIYWPAAKGLHHAVRGGLLMHTLTILRLAYYVYGIYSYLNYDLLCAGIILHDITKIDEIDSSETGVASEYTVKGNLLGHLVMGAIEIDETGKKLGVNEETLTLLEHMMISHHGVPEFGAAKYPMFPEAMALSMLDDLDAKMYLAHSALTDTESGSFSGKVWALDNRLLYNHGRGGDGDVNLR